MPEVTEQDVVISMSITQYALVQGMLTGFATLLGETVKKKKVTPKTKGEVADVIASINDTKAGLHEGMLDAVASAAGKGVDS